jgi:hypothetical protein
MTNRARLPIAVLVVLCLALAASPLAAQAAKPRGGSWVGKFDRYSVKVTFKVSASGRVMTKFTAKRAPLFCAFTEVIEPSTIFIPKAKISRAGKVNAKYETDDFENELKGRFTSPTKFKGNVYQAGGGCSGGFDFKARLR